MMTPTAIFRPVVSQSNQVGFTLLEVLIATSITVLIGVSAVQLLSSIGNANRASEENAASLAELQRFNQILSRDIEQYVDRDIRDEFGDIQPSLITTSDFALEFTRLGWRNSPTATNPRSTLQRVAYRLEEFDSEVCASNRIILDESIIDVPRGEQQCLVRYYWQVIDRASDSEAKAQVILQNIESLSFEILYSKQDDPEAEIESGAESTIQVSQEWPITFSQDVLITKGVRLRLNSSEMGEITRLWRIVATDTNEILEPDDE